MNLLYTKVHLNHKFLKKFVIQTVQSTRSSRKAGTGKLPRSELLSHLDVIWEIKLFVSVDIALSFALLSDSIFHLYHMQHTFYLSLMLQYKLSRYQQRGQELSPPQMYRAESTDKATQQGKELDAPPYLLVPL